MKINPANFRFTLSALAGLLIFMVCTGCDDPPEACFTPSVTLADVNGPVDFANCSERATGYKWDFGDGGTSTEASPSHTFAAEGQYIVSVVAKAKVSANDDTYKTLVVGAQRAFLSAQILNLPATNPSGGLWDPSDNPDIAVRFAQGSSIAYQSATLVDDPGNFPITVPPPASPLIFSPGEWTITVVDIDGLSEEVMASFTINTATFVPNANRQFALSASTSSMAVTYSLR